MELGIVFQEAFQANIPPVFGAMLLYLDPFTKYSVIHSSNEFGQNNWKEYLDTMFCRPLYAAAGQANNSSGDGVGDKHLPAIL